ncbi:plastocyanin/azurin family copper-binding protein [Chryseobacterium sp. M5A1_1a]
MKRKILSAIFFVAIISACTDKKNDNVIHTDPKAEDASVQQNQNESNIIEIVLNTNDSMKFDKTELKAKEGQIVKLTLVHGGTMPKSAMGHNFVLLKSDTDVSEFGTAAAGLAGPDYTLNEDLRNKTITFTKMIGGGEKATIEFIAPPKGIYTFICSYPGHYGMMKGNFIVE